MVIRNADSDDASEISANSSLTRRGLFEFAGLAIVVAAVPSQIASALTPAGPRSSQQGVSPVMETLSAYMSEAARRPLPEEVIEKTKQHILDTPRRNDFRFRAASGRTALQFARAYGGKEVATVVASNFLCGPIEAALTNGVLAHADETDDSHSPSQSHPGCAVVPAALAAGERFEISGTHFLRAVALGYDIGPDSR